MLINILIWPFKKNAYFICTILNFPNGEENTAQRGGHGFKFMNSGKRFNVALQYVVYDERI